MTQETIKCPECGAEFQLSQAISHDIEISVAKRYEKEMKELKHQSQQALISREKELKDQFTCDQRRIEESARKEKEEALQRLEIERKRIEEQAKKKAQDTLTVEMTALKEELAEKDRKLAQSQETELGLRKRQRELEEGERSLKLEVVRQVDAERQKIVETTQKALEDTHRLKDAENDKKLTDMHEQVDELKRKLEQGSQKMQGEILELELEASLKSEFPFDEIEPVPPGIKGADVIQVVKTQTGKICGKILWETKRTKIWSDSWLQKVKDDKREAKADIVILISETLPKGLTHFRMIDGVWVTSISTSLSLTLALRLLLIHVAREKRLEIGKKGKMEVVYNYLTGPEFKNRVEAIVESFIQMKNELDAEKRAMNRIWDKRDKQIERVILNIGGMHSDIEGIAGMTLPAIKALQLPESSEKENIDENKDAEIPF